MIILNNNLQMIYPFNTSATKDIITKMIILRKAYAGYVYYNKLDNNQESYYDFEKFSKMELWKIKFSFQIYIERVKKCKSLGFNPSNRTLLKMYFKTLI